MFIKLVDFCDIVAAVFKVPIVLSFSSSLDFISSLGFLTLCTIFLLRELDLRLVLSVIVSLSRVVRLLLRYSGFYF